ncbi:putative Glycosyl-transferase family 4_5 [Helianthus anomalus]
MFVGFVIDLFITTQYWKNRTQERLKIWMPKTHIVHFGNKEEHIDVAENNVEKKIWILFWLDRWVGDVPLRHIFASVFDLEQVKMCFIEDHLKTDIDGVGSNWFGSEDLLASGNLGSCRIFGSWLKGLICMRPRILGFRTTFTGSFLVKSIKQLL